MAVMSPAPPARTPHSPRPGPQAPTWHAAGVVIAATSRRFACWTINGCVVLAAVGAGWALGWGWGLFFGVAALVWEAAGTFRTGQSVGHRVARLRTVSKSTGMPGSFGAVLTGRCVTADLRAGRDPLALVPRPLPAAPPPPPPPPPPPMRVGTFVVVADDASRFAITGPTLVGRRADDPSGRYACLTIPDISKTLSRNHALLEPAPDGLRVTDVGSGNGSAIADQTPPRRIEKYQTVTISPGTRLRLGTRFFEITYE